MNKQDFINQFKSGEMRQDEGVLRYFDEAHPKHSIIKYRFSWIVPKITGKRVLEIGVGDGLGILLYSQLKKVDEIYAIDVDPVALERTKKNLLDGLGNADNIHLFEMMAEDMTFEDDYFDCVSLCETLEHVYDDVEALKQVYRVLKPGGRLVMTVPHGGKISKMHVRVFDEKYIRKVLKDFKIESLDMLRYPDLKGLYKKPKFYEAVVATKC
jgi:ubiquinone/menaquinone biosynthesis C-methylase UbiE